MTLCLRLYLPQPIYYSPTLRHLPLSAANQDVYRADLVTLAPFQHSGGSGVQCPAADRANVTSIHRPTETLARLATPCTPMNSR